MQLRSGAHGSSLHAGPVLEQNVWSIHSAGKTGKGVGVRIRSNKAARFGDALAAQLRAVAQDNAELAPAQVIPAATSVTLVGSTMGL